MGGVTDVLNTATLGLTGEILGLIAPEVPTPPSGPTAVETGQRAQEGVGKTFSEEEAASRRKAVRKKRLGTKALQIPLEKMASTGAATSTSLGIKV